MFVLLGVWESVSMGHLIQLQDHHEEMNGREERGEEWVVRRQRGGREGGREDLEERERCDKKRRWVFNCFMWVFAFTDSATITEDKSVCPPLT